MVVVVVVVVVCVCGGGGGGVTRPFTCFGSRSPWTKPRNSPLTFLKQVMEEKLSSTPIKAGVVVVLKAFELKPLRATACLDEGTCQATLKVPKGKPTSHTSHVVPGLRSGTTNCSQLFLICSTRCLIFQACIGTTRPRGGHLGPSKAPLWPSSAVTTRAATDATRVDVRMLKRRMIPACTCRVTTLNLLLSAWFVTQEVN